MRLLIVSATALVSILAAGCSSRVERFDYQVSASPESADYNRLGMPTKLVTVKQGDTLVSIAQRFGITPNAIRNVNNLKTDELVPGQLIAVPQPLR